MRGKQSYVQAVVKLGQYISKTCPEVLAIEAELETQFNLTGVVESTLENRLFERKAAALNQIIADMESGIAYRSQYDVQQ